MLEIERINTSLKREFVTVNGVRTAIFLTPDFADSAKPISILIHGIGSSHVGLLNLAAGAKKTRVILVDLPCHGDSDLSEWLDLENLRKWFYDLMKTVSRKYGAPSKILLHSFACYVFGQEKVLGCETILLCPVIPPSRHLYALAEVAARPLFQSKIAVKFYNWTPFSTARGFLMLRNKTPDNWQKIWFNAKNDGKMGQPQRRAQAILGEISNDPKVFNGVAPNLVLIGRFDKSSRNNSPEEIQTVFPRAKIISLDSGHLIQYDCADRLAQVTKL